MVAPGIPWTIAEESVARTMLITLSGYSGTNYAKWQRNFGRYQNNGKHNRADLWNMRKDVVPGYNPLTVGGTQQGMQTSINVLKSATDTVVSKMSQARVRPFFQAVHGDYKTIKSCRAAQEFFDGYFERENVYHVGALALRDACIFDKGILYPDEDTETIRSIKPWQLGLDPCECEYGKPTRASVVFKGYPIRLLEQTYGKSKKLDIEWSDPEKTDDLQILFDVIKREKWYFYGTQCFLRVKIEYKRLPFVLIYWTPPLKGVHSTSLIDENYSLQVDIDNLNLRIDAATRRAIINMVLVPQGSEIKTSTMTNEAGEFYTYNPGPTGGVPVVATPPAINDQFITLLKLRIQTLYENAGISQMSAQSKKPAGADSGRALQTLADIESERFNLTLQAYLRLFIDLASACIDVFPEDAEIVSGKYSTKAAKWRDVKKQRDSFNIQFAAASALSKDPTRRLAEIDAMVQRGMIPKEMAASLMQIPDVEGAYSVATAAYDYAQVVIERAIETGEIAFEGVTNLSLLFSESTRWLLRLMADEANGKYIDNLKKLLDAINEKLEAVEAPAPGDEPKPPSDTPQPAPAAQAGMPMAG
jgi:hypothetical protein